MDSSFITHTYEQKLPMWDDEEQTSTVQLVTHKIDTATHVPKLGVMLVGLGGNNGSTFTAGILANKLKTTWETK